LKSLTASEKIGLRPLGRVRLLVVSDASAKSLKPFIEGNIEKGSEVIADGWASYSFAASNGYAHTVRVGGKKRGGEQMLPHAHLAVSLIKRWLLGTHQGAVSDKHMQAHLEEYTCAFIEDWLVCHYATSSAYYAPVMRIVGQSAKIGLHLRVSVNVHNVRAIPRNGYALVHGHSASTLSAHMSM
jgi:hypothetical protein